jgi:hypothetical protein
MNIKQRVQFHPLPLEEKKNKKKDEKVYRDFRNEFASLLPQGIFADHWEDKLVSEGHIFTGCWKTHFFQADQKCPDARRPKS